MKPITLQVKGEIELPDSDMLKVLRLLVLKRAKDLTDAVSKVVQETYGLTPTDVKADRELIKVIAIIDSPVNANSKLIGKTLNLASNSDKGFKRQWKGFYDSAQAIFDELRRKNKHSLSFKEFYNRVLEVPDPEGGKRFVKKDSEGKQVKIEQWRVKQYTSPSQLKKTRQMKGVRWDERNQEFRF